MVLDNGKMNCGFSVFFWEKRKDEIQFINEKHRTKFFGLPFIHLHGNLRIGQQKSGDQIRKMVSGTFDGERPDTQHIRFF